MGLGIKTYLRYQLGQLTGPEKFEGHYAVWRARRIAAILDEYGHRFFGGKRILEVGAGFGAIGAFFAMLEADVTCIEGRAENVRVLRSRYPFVKAVHHDLAEGLPGQDIYDVLIHMGVLYHLPEAEPALRAACHRCQHMVLETEVADSDDPNLVLSAKEYAYGYDQSLVGLGSRPSPAFVERILKEEGFSFSRITDGRCNWELNVYDWPVTNSRQFRNGLRRMWFARKTPAV
jgi:SAM-dependent methyltransferase